MEIYVRGMLESDYPAVAEIYGQGLETKCATFQTEIPSYEDWDKGHLKILRYVAVDEMNQVVGWAALSAVSSRCVYRGVAEVSIYISADHRGKKIGSLLLDELIPNSEKHDIWTLQSSVIEKNISSIKLHNKAGFRMVGYRENIAQDTDGQWQNTVLLERRSKVVGIS